jgi:hypothetical protein
MKHKILFSFALLIFLFPSLLNAQCLPGWGYNMPITISNPNASILTNFQVRLTVNTAALVGAGQMQANGNDIRFMDGLCNNIDYWIESGINTATTYIWVKVPSIPASGNTTIYMYYSNVAAPASQNGDNVFLFFDDFNDPSLNLTKWTVRGTPSTLTESGGALTIVGNSNWEYIRSNTTWSGPVIIDSRESCVGPSAALILGYTGTDNRYTFRLNSTTKGTTYDNDVSGGNAWFNMAYPGVPHPTSGYNNYEIKTDLIANTITVSSYCDQTTSNCNTSVTALNQFTGTGFYVGYSTYSTGYTLNSDWIFARASAALDPTSSNGPPQANVYIATTLSSTSFCAGSSFTLNFDANGTYTAGNIFSAELSDAAGSFISPVVIGTLSSTSSGPQTIPCTISALTASGNGYRVRVVSSTPVVTGTDNGNNIIINALPTVTASSTASAICLGSSVTFNGGGASTYYWNGPVIINDNIPVTPTLAATGTYTVTGTDVNGCINTATISLTVNDVPTVTATANSGTICAGSSETLTASGATTYSWSSGGNASVEIVSPTSTSTYTVTGTDVNGCMNTATVSVNVNALPSVTASAASGTICVGSSETLTASGATTYSWSSGGNSAVEIVSPVTTSSYTVTGTDVNGCINTATVSVTVNALPTVAASSSGDICMGSSATLTASGATTYSWSSGGNASVEIVSPIANSSYTVTGTDANGCMNTATVSVIVNALPIVNLGSDITQCGGSVTLDAQNQGSVYVWSDNSTAQTLSVSSSGSYSVVVTDGNGCSNSDAINVTIHTPPVVTGTSSSTFVCILDAPPVLTGLPAGGNWSGPGVTGNTFNASFAGFGTFPIVYTYTDSNGCSDTASVIMTVSNCTGIPEKSIASIMNVYPNPSNGEFTLNVLGNENADVIIYDELGQSVQNFKVVSGVSSNIHIDVSGIYFIEMTTSSGQHETMRVVVSK